jgi:single-strand DNA-binding protein|tara:strand:+ start:49518 stop:49916 length:399 start_codon:yes stop_codon:yes gene_type:complete
MQKGSVNKVVLVGHMGANPETRFTPSGTAVANFNIATNESRKNAEGAFVDHTEWHSCVLFGKRAEFAGEYLKKGQLIYIEGRLQTRSWEDDSGTKKYKTEVVGSEVTMLGKKTDVGGGSREVNDSSDDDLPF